MASYSLGRTNKVFATTDEDAIERGKQNIRRLHNDPDVTEIYIGKTSAPSKSTDAAYKAMETRYDKTKEELGITNMKLQYITTSDRYINNAERELIEYSNKRDERYNTDKTANDRGGGGGAPTNQPYKMLYVAYKKS